MPEGPNEERRFSEEEVREILKRAVERAPSKALAKRDGLSLSELKAIGAEVGIEAERLEEAARTVALGRVHRPHPFLGAPTVLHVERKAKGELDPEGTPEVLALIRRTMGLQGEVSEIHGSLEWSAKGEAGERFVTLSSKGGETTISASANLTNAATLTYLPAGIIGAIASLAGLASFIKDGGIAGLVLFLVVLPIVYPILRTIFTRVSGAEERRLEEVVEELTLLTRGSDG